MYYTVDMPAQEKNNAGLAQLLGAGFAVLQHGMDKGIAWGLSRMKSLPDAPPAAKDAHTGRKLLSGAGHVFGSSIRFIGQTGDAYYRTYERLKQPSIQDDSYSSSTKEASS